MRQAPWGPKLPECTKALNRVGSHAEILFRRQNHRGTDSSVPLARRLDANDG